MTDNKKSEGKAASKQAAGKPAASQSSTKKSSVKKGSASQAGKGQAKDKKGASFVPAKGTGGTVATAKAGALSDADLSSAAKKIDDVDKKAADSVIKSKKSAEELKARAHEAKQRAQQKILEESYVSDKPEDPLERLANTFDSSAKRWEMVVYPSLFAFVLLAGYGFFLIYRLTHDISTLSQSVTRMAVIVSDAMPRMTKDLNIMTDSINDMTGNIDGMSTEIGSMSGQMNALTPMSNNIQSMTHNIGSMNRSVYGMQRDMHGMNRTVSSGPFGMMNDMMPFSSNTNVPPEMAPPPVWPTYNAVPWQPYPATTNNYVRRAPAKPVPIKRLSSKPSSSKPSPSKQVTTKQLKTKPAEKKSLATKVAVPGGSPVSRKESSSTN